MAVKIKEDISEVVQRVIDGTATESEKGLVLKTMQNSLSANLVGGLNDVFASMQSLNAMAVDAIAKLEEYYELNKDLLDQKALMDFIGEVQNRQLRLLELNRKISQGNNPLFAQDTLSEEERKVVKLFKSFRTNAEKAAFMRLVDQELNGR